MKQLFLGLLVSSASFSAFAQSIDLQPGSSIVVNGNVVRCLGTSPDELAPPCSIKQDGYSYRLYVGSVIAESYSRFDDAIAGAKKMKEAGLCR